MSCLAQMRVACHCLCCMLAVDSMRVSHGHDLAPAAASVCFSHSVQVAQAEARSGNFADNTHTFATLDANEKAVIDVIINNIKPGLENLDLRSIAPILAMNFELQYVPAATRLLREPRTTFLDSRREWTGQMGKVREIAYAIQDVQVDTSRTIGAVIAYTTYKSKYFNPHFLETLLFENTGDGWRLLRQTLVPIVPQKPDDLEVDIYLAAPQPDLFNDFAEIVLAKGPDHWLDTFLQQRRDWILTDQRKTAVLFVFREPLPVGAKITIEHSWKSQEVKHPPPEKLYYKVKRSQAYYVIQNESWVGCCAGDSATYKVYVNGARVAEKTVVVRK